MTPGLIPSTSNLRNAATILSAQLMLMFVARVLVSHLSLTGGGGFPQFVQGQNLLYSTKRTRNQSMASSCLRRARCGQSESCYSSSLEWRSMDSICGISYYLNKYQLLSNTSWMTVCLSTRYHTTQSKCGSAKLSTWVSREPRSPSSPALNSVDYKICGVMWV